MFRGAERSSDSRVRGAGYAVSLLSYQAFGERRSARVA